MNENVKNGKVVGIKKPPNCHKTGDYFNIQMLRYKRETMQMVRLERFELPTP